MSKIKGMTTVFFKISTTSGRKKLMPDDVKIPKDFKVSELARLGSKAAFDPASLRVFENVRRETQAYLTSLGIRYGGGYGVPTHKLPEIKAKIALLEEKFNMGKEALLNQYVKLRDDWFFDIERINPVFAETIKNNVISKEYLESQIHFRFYSEEDEARTAGSTLIYEVSEAAKDAMDKLIQKDKTTVFNRRSLASIVNIKDKLESLSFLNTAVNPTIDRINKFLAEIPAKGTLGSEWLGNLVRELSFLSIPSNIEILGAQSECQVTKEDINSEVKTISSSQVLTNDFLSYSQGSIQNDFSDSTPKEVNNVVSDNDVLNLNSLVDENQSKVSWDL